MLSTPHSSYVSNTVTTQTSYPLVNEDEGGNAHDRRHRLLRFRDRLNSQPRLPGAGHCLDHANTAVFRPGSERLFLPGMQLGPLAAIATSKRTAGTQQSITLFPTSLAQRETTRTFMLKPHRAPDALPVDGVDVPATASPRNEMSQFAIADQRAFIDGAQHLGGNGATGKWAWPPAPTTPGSGRTWVRGTAGASMLLGSSRRRIEPSKGSSPGFESPSHLAAAVGQPLVADHALGIAESDGRIVATVRPSLRSAPRAHGPLHSGKPAPVPERLHADSPAPTLPSCLGRPDVWRPHDPAGSIGDSRSQCLYRWRLTHDRDYDDPELVSPRVDLDPQPGVIQHQEDLVSPW